MQRNLPVREGRKGGYLFVAGPFVLGLAALNCGIYIWVLIQLVKFLKGVL